jgi:hypothetical protein
MVHMYADVGYLALVAIEILLERVSEKKSNLDLY